jgi:formylglycine-generating enzyme
MMNREIPKNGLVEKAIWFGALMLISATAAFAADPVPVRLVEKPLTTEQAQSAQKAWADQLGFEVVFENSIGMQLRVIPPGTYRMSSSPKAEVKGPVEVTLSQAFLIGQFEVTQGEWERVMGPIERKLGAGAGDRFPVYGVDHAEASEFCRKLTQLDREAGKLPDGYEYRLPTNVEWEFACRAGTLTLTHFGDKMSSRLANFDGTRPLRDSEKGPNLGRTAEVGSYPANAWGLHDMHGNSDEWCMDWYHYEVEGGVDPVQLQPSDRGKPRMTTRGSGWGSPGKYVHSANRYHSPPGNRNYLGCRPVLTKVQHGKVAAIAHADGSVEPARVLMTEHALTAEQAQSVQKAWAEHIGLEVAFENSIGMKLRVIPPGTWHMRSPQAEKGQKGPVEVTLSQAFLIGQFEVTQGEWKRVMGPIEGKLDAGVGDRFPAYHVNHTEATEFCRKLTQLDREAGKLPDGYEYRLQTAAEGEFACRAGTLTRTHFGDKISSRLANYDGTHPFRDFEKGPNLGRTAEVGSYPANAWGLHDMHGNVSEWCMDWYHDKVEGGVDPVHLQPSDGEKPHRMFRPCSWRSPSMYCHSAHRYRSPPESRSAHIGFRPVLTNFQPTRELEAEKDE